MRFWRPKCRNLTFLAKIQPTDPHLFTSILGVFILTVDDIRVSGREHRLNFYLLEGPGPCFPVVGVCLDMKNRFGCQ